MSTDAATLQSDPSSLSDPSLPNDVDVLQVMLREALEALGKGQRRIEQLEHRLDQLLRRVYGQKSEQVDPAQRLLFVDEQEPALDSAFSEPAPAVSTETPSVCGGKKKGHGRGVLPASLPRVRQVHDLTEAEKLCPCCHQPRRMIGEETSEQLEYVPASLFVLQHVRPKYACAKCQEHVAVGAKPPQPIEKGLPGPGLLAQVAVSKYGDHLPLNRLERIFARQGVNLSRQTMCDWMQAMAERLEPRVDLMRERILWSKGIQTDDTPVNVLDGSRDKTKQGRLWVYRGDESQPYTVFDYTPNRSRAGPKAWLGRYRGYLQADAYAGYDELFRTNRELIEVGCWAHARRYFFESKESDPSRALEALARIQQWYAVENEVTVHETSLGRRDPEHRRAQRQTRSRPLLESFHALLVTWQREVLPKSPLGQAVHYALAQWTALMRFLADGNLSIDNNASERDLRAVAIGRKNWLFCGSDRGGKTAAILFSILATCRRHGIEPFAYLRELMSRPVPQSPDSLAALFPGQSSASTAG